jgi:glycosyltransferase involved in cell wall biosynthesis
MRVLSIVTSSNQLYSGIGRALFELSRRLRPRIAYEFAIDDRTAKNVDLLTRFGRDAGFPVHVGPACSVPHALDPRNADLPRLLRRREWDAIECVGWADAATHDAVLYELGDRALFYTPHHQPTWTVPMSAHEATTIEAVHHRMVRRADVVLCDSPWELRTLRDTISLRSNCTFLPLGCDFRAFRAGPPERKPQLLFVGDLAEPRKRFDRVLTVLSRLLPTRPDLRLVVVGNRSDQVAGQLPAEVRHACELRGYVSESDLRGAYAESAGLVLLSDFEAFGIPILEALACGTPVFLSEQEATQSLFGGFKGARFCPADDLEATLGVFEAALSSGSVAVSEAIRDRGRLEAAFNWEILAERKWQALSAGRFRHRTSA